MFQRLRQMLVKEFLQLFRDPRMRGMVLVVPVVQMLVIAFALTSDVTDISTAVLDDDNTRTSRELVQAFTSSNYFKIVKVLNASSDIKPVLDKGSAQVALHIQAGFENEVNAGRTAKVQLLADGTKSNSCSIIFAYANQIVESFSGNRQKERYQAQNGAAKIPPGVEIASRAWFNVNMESKYFYVPGLIAVMLLVNSMMLSSIAIVREKEIGTIEQMMVTPITRMEFILGKTVPYCLISYLSMSMMFVLAMIFFDIRVHGSWLLLYALSGVYIAGNLGLALCISASASTQQQALLTAFFIMMPAVLLSGFMFPVDNMPEPVQYLTWLNPMRWFLEILRAIVLKGEGLRSIWQAALWQSGLAVAFLILAAASFKKTLS
jgi:ABC-2 type transport system permease protein